MCILGYYLTIKLSKHESKSFNGRANITRNFCSSIRIKQIPKLYAFSANPGGWWNPDGNLHGFWFHEVDRSIGNHLRINASHQ